MKISKRIHSNNLNYILAAAIIYCMVVLFVICANWMTGSHVFDFHLYFSTKKGPKVVVHYMFCAWNLTDLRWGIDSE